MRGLRGNVLFGRLIRNMVACESDMVTWREIWSLVPLYGHLPRHMIVQANTIAQTKKVHEQINVHEPFTTNYDTA